MSNIAPTVAEFTAKYPNFATEQYSAILPAQLSLSSRLLSTDAWEEFYSDAVELDCAHNLVLAAQSALPGGSVSAAAGPISSASGAGISTSFATTSPSDKHLAQAWYQKTAYGQMFLRLQTSCIPIGFIC